jgi:hypothetical protein
MQIRVVLSVLSLAYIIIGYTLPDYADAGETTIGITEIEIWWGMLFPAFAAITICLFIVGVAGAQKLAGAASGRPLILNGLGYCLAVLPAIAFLCYPFRFALGLCHQSYAP